MNTDIVIRTYRGDKEWLAHALESLRHRAHGFRKILVIVPDQDYHLFSHLTLEEVHRCPAFKDDYLGQQVTKLSADLYTDADFIMHWDSDSILTEDVTPETFMVEGRPIIYKEPYSALEGVPWQPIVAEALGWTPEFEFMRRHPFVYPRKLYRDVRRHLEGAHGVNMAAYVTSRPARSFSEFNVMGAYAWSKCPELFTWRHPSEDKCVVRQFWSWGGITDEIRAEIRSHLP